MSLHLKVITPKKLVFEHDVESLTVPSATGEITILNRHIPLVSLLKEGVLTIRMERDEEYMSIGGGYMETDGKTVSVLVSRAYNQTEIDEQLTEQAVARAQEMLKHAVDKTERTEAVAVLHRSLIDLSLLRRLRGRGAA